MPRREGPLSVNGSFDSILSNNYADKVKPRQSTLFRFIFSRSGAIGVSSNIKPIIYKLILVLAVILVSLRGSNGALKAEDASTLFNYYNNIQEPVSLFFYAGYISVVPSIVARIFALASMPAQLIAYLVTAILVGCLLALKLAALFARRMPPSLAAAFAALVVAVVHFSLGHSFFGLVYSIWVMGLVMLIMVLDLFDGKRLSIIDIVISIAFSLSSPTALVLVPFLIVWAWRGNSQKAMAAFLAIVILTFYIVVLLLNPGQSTFDPRFGLKLEALGRQIATKHPMFLLDLAILSALLFAFFSCLPGFIARFGSVRERDLIVVASGFGLGVFVLYGLSTRFLEGELFSPRFIMPARFCLCVVVLMMGVRFSQDLEDRWKHLCRSRAATMGAVGLVVAFLSVYMVSGAVQSSFADLVARMRFVQRAEEWRRTCVEMGPAVLIFDPNDPWSPAVMCQRRRAPGNEGFHAIAEDGLLSGDARGHPPQPSIYIGVSIAEAINRKLGRQDAKY